MIDRTGLILISSPSVRTATRASCRSSWRSCGIWHAAGARLDPPERQRGGSIGLRGPGETQLETDRRLLQKRVEQLQKRLVEVQRTQMRRVRVRSELPRVALVGYTNAGKSTLFNAMTGAEAYAADQLFATLDPTVRRIAVPGGNVVLADTVGFVRDLPHDLVAAFRSTLSRGARPISCCTWSMPPTAPRGAHRPGGRSADRSRCRRSAAAAGVQQDRPH